MDEKKKRLYTTARQLFSEKGFADTSVADITHSAEMAVGTFYLHYTSKEQLFMDIFLEENTSLKKTCLSALDLDQPPMEIVRQMLAANLAGMQANPILREWYNRTVFQKIEKKFLEQNGIQAVDFLYDTFLEIIKQWQVQGKIRSDIDSKMIMMIFAAVINVDTHKEEIGIEYFPQLLEQMTYLIMQSLIITG